MTARDTARTAFLASTGWSDAARSDLAGDASNRRYDRLKKADEARAVLMDAPASRGEDVRPFIKMTEHLSSLRLSAPQILGSDPSQGFLLLEDLGDGIYARVIEQNPDLERPLYSAAIDALIVLHSAPPALLDVFNADVSGPLAALAFEWYGLGTAKAIDMVAKADFVTAFDPLLRSLDADDSVVILRDYHAENLIWLPERAGPARVGLLDYQDAMLGHPAYDLVSILQDARRDVSAQIEHDMVSYFLAKTSYDPDAFLRAYAIMGAQRNLRILGVFARLCMRDGKAHYVDMIPRVWAHVQTNLAHPSLAPVADVVNTHLPAPTPDLLQRLKAQCATHQMR